MQLAAGTQQGRGQAFRTEGQVDGAAIAHAAVFQPFFDGFLGDRHDPSKGEGGFEDIGVPPDETADGA